MHDSNYAVGPIHAKGAVTVDFALPGNLPLDQLPPVIERDRMIMAKRPGMRQKHLPFRVDLKSGNILSGGRYLFDTVESAKNYRSWVKNDFVLDGIKFFDRPFFIDPVCHVWRVIGAHDLADTRAAHGVIRFERWQVPPDPQNDQVWPLILKQAERRALSSVWLLHNEQEHLIGLVSIADRVKPTRQQQSEDASLSALESCSSLGTMFEQPGWKKVFDRTSWVLTIWFPISDGRPEMAALWPNSPPLPAPAGNYPLREVNQLTR
jgi:hypothetical protein